MKELLSRAGVPFVTRNVELDLEAYRELIARGFRMVPVTFIGDESAPGIKGFDEAAIMRALGSLEPVKIDGPAAPPSPDR